MYVSNHVGSDSSTAAAGRAAPGPGRRPPRRRRAPRGACSSLPRFECTRRKQSALNATRLKVARRARRL